MLYYDGVLMWRTIPSHAANLYRFVQELCLFRTRAERVYKDVS